MAKSTDCVVLQVRVIEASIENGPWCGTFLVAQNIVREVLENSYRKFLLSPFCTEYIREKTASSVPRS